jgi:primosomal replication protein N
VNRVDLTGRIVEVSTLRYSPSGLPVVELKLEHESTIEDTGIPRKIYLTLRSIAMGSVAESLIKLQIDSHWLFTGFLASAKNSKSIVFHIQSIQTVS